MIDVLANLLEARFKYLNHAGHQMTQSINMYFSCCLFLFNMHFFFVLFFLEFFVNIIKLTLKLFYYGFLKNISLDLENNLYYHPIIKDDMAMKVCLSVYSILFYRSHLLIGD